MPFIELHAKSKEAQKFLLSLPYDTEKPFLSTKTKKLSQEIFSAAFSPDKVKKAIVATEDGGAWVFTDIDNNKWEWIGTLREMVAQNIVASVCNALNRVGLNEHEWLRKRKPF